MYERIVKRFLDLVISIAAGVILAIPFLVIAAVIKMDDHGPVFFAQKRVGKGKRIFWMYKFRSMKVHMPDIPTHLLEHPEQHITRTGGMLRKYSLDELPQLCNVFRGELSLIGPRPALWNQDDLITERDKYGANSIRPGLTGWAQINGRDELDIAEKAKLDGEYAEALKAGGWGAFLMDARCFFGTFLSVLRHTGVVEGGTGKKEHREVVT